MYHIEIMISNCSYKALVFNPEKFSKLGKRSHFLEMVGWVTRHCAHSPMNS